MKQIYPYVSLFSGGGIGDIGFRNSGLTPLILNEIDEERAALAKLNFPEAEIIPGDVWNETDRIIGSTKSHLSRLGQERLFLLSATPPCQGMSKNGIGSNLKAIRDGLRPKQDPRNYLFAPALTVLQALRPSFFFFENVDRMANAFIVDEDENQVLLLKVLTNRLLKLGYIGEFHHVNMANYGLPQNRLRMVGLFMESEVASTNKITLELITSFFQRNNEKKHLTLRDAIGHLPTLDSKSRESARSDYHPLHKVPVSRPDLYYWIYHTKEGDTAFNNHTCPNCKNVVAKSEIHCICGTLLPKPVVISGGELRKIKGFVSAYKRMRYDEPSPTITTRSAYAGSDNNLHPVQNRVLSILEVAILQGLGVKDYHWGPFITTNKGKIISKEIAHDTLIRDVLGEPVPPIFSKAVGEHLITISQQKEKAFSLVETKQLTLL